MSLVGADVEKPVGLDCVYLLNGHLCATWCGLQHCDCWFTNGVSHSSGTGFTDGAGMHSMQEPEDDCDNDAVHTNGEGLKAWWTKSKSTRGGYSGLFRDHVVLDVLQDGFCLPFEDCSVFAVLKTDWRYGPVCCGAATLSGMSMA